MTFPNRAGNHPDNDAVLRAELEAAGIDVAEHEFLRATSGEVKTAVIGTLHGWTFQRAWYYWVCKGPGIEVAAAERLHATHGKTVRVEGHCGCPSPREAFHGLACGLYHVDDAPGLKALADTIKNLVRSAPHENKAARQTDGTDRLCMAVYGRPAKPRDYIGGANAQMLYDAADLVSALTPSPLMSHSFKETYGAADQLHKANAARTPPNP